MALIAAPYNLSGCHDLLFSLDRCIECDSRSSPRLRTALPAALSSSVLRPGEFCWCEEFYPYCHFDAGTPGGSQPGVRNTQFKSAPSINTVRLLLHAIGGEPLEATARGYAEHLVTASAMITCGWSLRAMCGRPLGCKRKNEKSDRRVDCDHVSGLLDAAPCPLAQMGSAIQSQAMKRLRKPRHRTGSLDRRFDRSSSHSSSFTPASTRGPGGQRLMP